MTSLAIGALATSVGHHERVCLSRYCVRYAYLLHLALLVVLCNFCLESSAISIGELAVLVCVPGQISSFSDIVNFERFVYLFLSKLCSQFALLIIAITFPNESRLADKTLGLSGLSFGLICQEENPLTFKLFVLHAQQEKKNPVMEISDPLFCDYIPLSASSYVRKSC